MLQSLSNLPLGAKVKFGKYSVNGETAQDIIWLVVDKDHKGYPANSVTLFTEKCIDLRCFDAIEQNHIGQPASTVSGNNNYGLSNIDAWLNSSQVSWYTSRHPNDTPPTNENTTLSVGYADRPGFLYHFTPDERNAILTTPLVVTQYPETLGSLSRKVFLPSYVEVGAGYSSAQTGDTLWAYMSSYSCATTVTQQCLDYTMSTSKPSATDNVYYWSRCAHWFNSVEVNVIAGGTSARTTHQGDFGVRPVVNLSSSVSITDTTDADGCYVVTFNTAPSTPAILNVPTIYGGKSNAISWSNSTDLQGDTITYQLECSIDGGNYETIYNGTSTVYAHIVPFGTGTVAYRVNATDPSGMSSAYITSTTISVINNNAPVISGSDTNLGVKSDDFTGTYTITDANSDVVTVTEAIDGVQIRALVATLGSTITYGVTGNTWLALPNGSHTLTISATDGIDTTVRTLVFTKLANKLTIQNSTPWTASTMPSRIMLVVTRNVPSAATFKVEVCNNGYDASPTWEDATDAVKSGLVHVFSNTKKTASNWGVLVKVTVERNGATGACYVSAIGGNFE